MSQLTRILQLNFWISLFPKAVSVAVAAWGGTTLLAWARARSVTELPGILDGIWPMTALTLALIGGALLILSSPSRSCAWRRTGLALAFLGALVCAMMLFEAATGVSLGVDGLLYPRAVYRSPYPHPGRIPPNTALSLLLIGASLMLIDHKTRGDHYPSQLIALVASLISLLALIGHIYQVTEFYLIAAYAPMALASALALGALCLSVLLVRPYRGVLRSVTSEHEEASISRQLLLASVIGPILLGWMIAVGYHGGWYDALWAASLFALGSILFFATLVWSGSNRLYAAGERRREAETRLRQSEARYRQIIETAEEGVWIIDRHGSTTLVNPRMAALLGYRVEEMLGQPVVNFVCDESLPVMRDSLRRQMAGRRESYVASLHRRDGSRIHVMVSASPFHESGKFMGAVGMITDITEIMQIERSLSHSLELLKATLESTVDGILAVDSQGRVSSYNRRFLQMWRIPPEIIESQDDSRLLRYVVRQLEDPDEFLRKVESLYRSETEESMDTIRFKDGRIFERHSMPRTVGQRHVGRVWNFRDVTAQRKLEEQLQGAIRDREEILGIVSHDLKNPLGAILMNAQLLTASSCKESRIARHAQIISLAAGQMHRMIGDLMDQARIEAGKLTLEIREVRVAELMEAAREIVEPLARQREIDLEFRPVDPALAIECDRGRLLQVLSNILGNAIKFTPRRGRVAAGAVPRGEQAEFMVTDTGPGIPEEQREKVFLRFWQSPLTRKAAGAGLGLSIARGIVESHAGRIWVESSPGRGSTFRFRIPRKAQVAAAAPLERAA